MKSSSFVLSAIILALGGFFAKAIGALYKIPLTNILGSSGMGLYYLIFPVYSLILTFCSSGLNVALATEVSKCRKVRNRYNEQKLLRVSLVFSFVISLVFAILIIAMSVPLAEAQGNINARLGYIAIAPAIIISSLISTLRGYFQGVENMVPTTVSMIIEQIVKLSSGLILAHKLCVYGIQYAVLGAVIGVTISEVVALIIISINFFTFKGQLYYNYKNLSYRGKRKINVRPLLKFNGEVFAPEHKIIKSKYFLCLSQNVRYTTKVALKRLVSTLIPATLSSIILPIATMLDSFMIINILVESGFSSFVSTSLYGLWGGVVQSLISLPTILIAGISTSMVPSLSGGVAGQEAGQICRRVKFFIKITLVLSIIMFVLIFVFAGDILYFLYGDGLTGEGINELFYATKMLKISSVSILYYAFLQTFTVILQTTGKSHIPFIVLLGGLVMRLVLTVVLVSNSTINIFGAIIANIVFLSGVTLVLAIFIKKYMNIEFKFVANLMMPLTIGTIVLAAMDLCHRGLKMIVDYFSSMIISAIIGTLIYFVWVYFGKIFDAKEKNIYFRRNKKLTQRSNLTQKTH